MSVTPRHIRDIGVWVVMLLALAVLAVAHPESLSQSSPQPQLSLPTEKVKVVKMHITSIKLYTTARFITLLVLNAFSLLCSCAAIGFLLLFLYYSSSARFAVDQAAAEVAASRNVVDSPAGPSGGDKHRQQMAQCPHTHPGNISCYCNNNHNNPTPEHGDQAKRPLLSMPPLFRFSYLHRDSLASEIIQPSVPASIPETDSETPPSHPYHHHHHHHHHHHKQQSSPAAHKVQFMSPTSWRRWRIPSILRRIATSIRYGSMLQITRLPVSTRLIFIASVFDVAYTNFRIYKLIASQYGHSSVHRQEHCKAAMWGTSFFALLSVFSRALLSFHLQLVVIHKVRHAMTYEYRYLCGSVLIALLLSLLPLSKGGYGWVDFEFTVGAGCCGYFSRWATIIDYSDHVATVRFDTTNYSVRGGMGWMWGTYFGWIALTVAYSCIVIIIVLCKIIHDRVRMVNAMQGQAASMHLHNERREFLAVLLRATRRIAQFPALVVFCHSLEVAWGSITVQHILSLDTGRVDVDIGSEKGWFFAMQVVLCFQGILTLSFLPFETPIRNFLNAWIEQIRDNHTTTKLTGSNVDDDDDGDDAADRRGDNYGWRSNSDLDPSSSGQRVVCPPASASKQHAKQPPFLSRLFSSTAFREARLNSIVQMQAGAQIPYSMANNQSYASNTPARTPCRINFATINSPDDLPWDIVIHEPVVQEPRSGRPLTASPHAAIPTLTFVGSSSNSSGDGGSNLTTPFNVPLTAPVVDNAYLHPLDHHHHYYHHRHGGASPGLTQKRGYRAFIEPHRRSSLTNVCFPPSRDSGSSISSFATNRADSAPTKCSIHTLNAASAASPLQDTADSPDNGHSGTCRSASFHAYAHNT